MRCESPKAKHFKTDKFQNIHIHKTNKNILNYVFYEKPTWVDLIGESLAEVVGVWSNVLALNRSTDLDENFRGNGSDGGLNASYVRRLLRRCAAEAWWRQELL